MFLFIVAIIVIVLGLLYLLFLLREQKNLGSLGGSVVALDNGENNGLLLSSTSVPLVGKPDYLIKQGSVVLPVEVKTGKTPVAPHRNHIVQLIAYCLLVEENFGVAPLKGVIRYPEKEFEVPYTEKAKEKLQKLVGEILVYKKINQEFQCHHPYHQV